MADDRDQVILTAASRIGELRAAVVAARDVISAFHETFTKDPDGLGWAAGADLMRLPKEWLDRFGPLGVLPEVEVEDDDDPQDTPMEGALWVRESSEPVNGEERYSEAARRERAAWTRDVADILRAQVSKAPQDQKAGFRAAADLLDPRPGR